MRKDKIVMIGDKFVDTDERLKLTLDSNFKRVGISKVFDRQISGNHYKNMAIQPLEYIYRNNIPYLEGNVIKYVSRHRFKNGIIDLRKAKHYLELIAELEYGEEL